MPRELFAVIHTEADGNLTIGIMRTASRIELNTFENPLEIILTCWQYAFLIKLA